MRKASMTGSIGFRLSLAVVTVVFAGFLISVTAFLLDDFRQTIAAERERLQSSAAAFAAAISDSVSIGDRRGALEVLRGISDLPHVNFSVVRNTAGQVLAEIGTGARLLGRDGSIEEMDALSTFFAESLTVDSEIRHAGVVVGALELQAEIGWLRARYFDSLAKALVFGFVLMVLTAFVARISIVRIIRPLRQLSEQFINIGERSDLTQRLKHDRNDEVGVLVTAFNDMFSRIDERDQQLRRHRDTLEETVEVRTAEMRAARDEAERANAAKSDFLATMSHEIRTPMNGMMVMAEMLSAAPLSERYQRYSAIIMRSGRGLLDIINDILDFSKIEAGHLEIEAIPFSIDTLVEDVASLFGERAREKNLTIALCVAPEVPRSLVGDPTRFNQVLTNLVNNALKFTESGGVTVEVEATQAPDGCRIHVHVRDTGIGIADDKISQIFERFTQEDQTITRKFGGTGLGLAITKRLVDAMGGQIVVTSEKGVGTDFCFSLTLPVDLPADGVMLPDVAVQIVDKNPIAAAAAERAMIARGARLVRSGSSTIPQLVLARAGDANYAAAEYASISVPVVAMRPFSGSSGVASAIDIAGEIQLPFRRSELDLLANCMKTGDFLPLGKASTQGRTLIELPDLLRLRVLGVDDTAVNREVLYEALGGFRIVPDLAASGEEAIEMSRAGPYDVIFMDCSMPGMDGYAATGEIRRMEAECGRKPCAVIALTAHIAGAEAGRWKVAGMDGYLAKPFSIQELASMLAPMLDSREDLTGSTDAHPALASLQVEAAVISGADSASDQPLISPDTLDMFAALSGTGGASVATKIFGIFQQNAPRGLKDLQEAVTGEVGDAAKLAHALKSMCSSAGARRAAMMCEDIERMLNSAEPVDAMQIANLSDTVLLSIAEMTRLFPAVPDRTESASVKSNALLDVN